MTLSETWFAEGHVDFEYQQYRLLAYLKQVNRYFNENKLYPQLADLIFHYQNMVAFRENKTYLQEQFPQELTAINLQKLQLIYQRMIEDSFLMEELERIIQYATGQLRGTITSGTELYEWIEQQIQIVPVGIIPLHIQEGYLFLYNGAQRDTIVYEYRVSVFEQQHEKFRGIHVQQLDCWPRNLVNTPESIKRELIHRRKEWPNPAVYAVECPLTLPVDETLLPIAKRSLIKYISAA